ncbi:uncharacterized protein LOC108091989 [Drosophila ficusphila]|uniref:uncharacterized protein LOC108091989 n=1 Tax=Drosophila ficusphila TaxID=30025 RepID=UPI0007E6FF18|nr:uncharacterized protein LOC108091989 [Drosophila ficusphila]
MSQALVNEETLEAMVYERSKAWSSAMKNFSTMDDGLEIDVSQLEELFQAEDENDLKVDEEEAVEDNVEEEKLELCNINANTTSLAELTMILCAGKDKGAKAEIEQILNQTMPVVEEHNRKWREAGLDRILATFDEKQIEHHVGGWMRRHNSVYLEAPPPKHHYQPDHSISDESDESLHSIDTARYIQQSRRRNAHMTNKNSNLTTIKMYRKHSHKRDELRAKYGYDDEQEHRHHMQAVLHRRREKEHKLAYLAATPMHCIHSGSHHGRRKHLRKRRANSYMFDSLSSSDDDPSFGACDCHGCRRHHALSRSAYQYCPYGRPQHEYHHRQAASRTMHTLRRHHTFDTEVDLRPRMPENECSCCNSDRLCSNVVHIANSSTEEWVVENRSSPLVLETPSTSRKHKLVSVKKSTPQSSLSKCRDPKSPKRKAVSASKLVRSKANYMKMFDSDISDDERVPRRRRGVSYSEQKSPVSAGNPTSLVASTAKKASKKVITLAPKALPEIKEEEATPMIDKRSKGSSIPKINEDHDKSISSDESEISIRGRKRLVSFSKAHSKAIGFAASSASKDLITKPPLVLPQINDKNVTKNSFEITKKIKKREMVNEAKNQKNEIVAASDENKTLATKSLSEKDTGIKSKCSAEKRVSKQKDISDNSGSLPQINEETGKSESLEKNKSIINPANPLVIDLTSPSQNKRGRPKQSKRTPSAERNTSTPGAKKTTSSSIKKKTKSATIPNLPKIAEEAPNASPDSQTKPEPNPSVKVPKPKNTESSDGSSDSEEDLQRALALSKTTYKKEQLQRQKTKKQTSIEQPQSPAEQSLAVFNNQSVACNSTALANDTACKRVLPRKQGIKRAAAVSSTEEQLAKSTSDKPTKENKAGTLGGDPDCTVVTSTTGCESVSPPNSEPVPPPLKITKRGILLHSSSAPGSENFTLTEQGLGKFIGDRWARKYLKYHIGSRSFDSRHSVYYQPTPQLAAALSVPHNEQTLANISTSSASDDDIFEQFNRYGTVYSVLEKSSKE